MGKLLTLDQSTTNTGNPYRPLKNGETASLLTIDDVEKTADFTALANYSYSVNSATGTVKVKLPSTAENGATITLQDTGAIAAVNNITIRNTADTSTWGVLDVNSGVITFVYNTIAGKWFVSYKTPISIATQYLKYSNSNPQSSISAGNQVLFNTLESSIGSSISINTSTGTITLQPGFIYRLRAGVTFVASNGSACDFQYMWRNNTAGTFIGNKAYVLSTGFVTVDGAYMGTCEAVITPTIATQVSVTCINAGNVTSTNAAASPAWCEVEAISSSTPINNLTYSGTVISSLANGTTLGTSSASPLTIMSVNLPVAGTYQITGYMPYLSATSGKVLLGLSIGGSLVANSTCAGQGFNQAGLITDSSISNTWQVTVGSANTVVSLVQWSNTGNACGSLYNNAANGFSQMTYELISVPTSASATPVVITTTTSISATTTAPTKGTTILNDYITLIDDGSGYCRVSMNFTRNGNTGSANGSGDYTVLLPGGYEFDLTAQPVSTNIRLPMSNFADMGKLIPANGTVSIFNGTNTYVTIPVGVVPASATRFKVAIPEKIDLATLIYWGGDWYQLAHNAICCELSFTFKKS